MNEESIRRAKVDFAWALMLGIEASELTRQRELLQHHVGDADPVVVTALWRSGKYRFMSDMEPYNRNHVYWIIGDGIYMTRSSEGSVTVISVVKLRGQSNADIDNAIYNHMLSLA